MVIPPTGRISLGRGSGNLSQGSPGPLLYSAGRAVSLWVSEGSRESVLGLKPDTHHLPLAA